MFVLLSFLSNTGFNFVIGLLLARFLGPDQYGRFALAVAVAVGIQTIAFDWARVAAVRFYSERVAGEHPGVRATLDATLAVLVAAVLGCGLLVTFVGDGLPLPSPVIGLAVGLAVVNGAFDYGTALIRARFRDRAYARLIMGKNLLSVVLTLGSAWRFGSAAVAVVGLAASMAGGLLIVRRDIGTPPGGLRPAQPRLARKLLGYALPVVSANLLYQTIPLADRLFIAHLHGFASSGEFSLAYDIGVRVVAAIGSALDVLLFQIAVRADETHGAPQARQQVGRNIGIVVAVLLPACTGLWLVLPSFEVAAVPPEFRGPFAADLRLLLPGLFCYGLIFFAAHPVFQIERRTLPLVVVGAVAAAANLLFIAMLPAGAEAAAFAAAQVGALAVALLTLCAWGWAAVRPAWPPGRDLAGAAAATAAMAAVIRLLPAGAPSLPALALQVCAGVAVYGAAAWTFDLCGLRREGWPALRRRLP